MIQCRDSSYLFLFPWFEGPLVQHHNFTWTQGITAILLQGHAKLNSRGSCNQGLEVLNTMLKITCRFGLHLQYCVKYAYTGNVSGIQRGKWRERWVSKPIALTKRNITPSKFRNSAKNFSILLP